MSNNLGEFKSSFYFNFCGEINTEKVLSLARSCYKDLKLKNLIIASETGRSALKALEIFKETEIRIIVVTHYPATTWGPKGKIPIGLKRKIYTKTLQELIKNDVRIVQGSRPFAPPSRSIKWNSPTPEGIIAKTLEVFGAGTKIAIEAAIMATDAGEIKEGEKTISCAGTFKGLDTCLVVKPTYSMNFFKEFEIMEIVARPSYRVKKLPEYKYEKWKGDLAKYYL